MDNKQKRITISFRENDHEQELYNWIKASGVIGGDSAFIKALLYKAYQDQKGN